ncbi:hypothetical protein QUB10_16250, partial [Microcoleus sp. B5-D4]
ALSRMIHFYPLNPRMCQLGVRNVGYKGEGVRNSQMMRGWLYRSKFFFKVRYCIGLSPGYIKIIEL